MDGNSRESSENGPNSSGRYNVVQAPVIGLAADESFPVFVPVRFTSMWLQDNAKSQSSNDGKETYTSKMFLTDKERPLNSRAYKPTPYCKIKPFTAVTIQKSASTNAVPTETPSKKRKFLNETTTTERKFKFRTATPYRRPCFAESVVQKTCQDAEKDSPFSPPNSSLTPLKQPSFSDSNSKRECQDETYVPTKTPSFSVESLQQLSKPRTHHVAATWPPSGMIIKSQSVTGEKLPSHVSPKFPVPFKKAKEDTAEMFPDTPRSDDLKEPTSDTVTELSMQASRILAEQVANIARSPDHQNLQSTVNKQKKRDAAAKTEQYYKRIMGIVDAIRKDQEREKAMKNDIGNDGQKAFVVVKENVTATEECNITEKYNDSNVKSRGGGINLPSNKVKDKGRIIKKIRTWKKSTPDVLWSISVWFLRFIQRYLFLTFILIRIFH